VVARLVAPEIHLAAWGGTVWPLALVVESPIIMLLSASTALSKDRDSYLRLRRFMMRASAVLTVLHVWIAFTPLYYVVAVEMIGAPAEIVEPGRLGMMIMVPWTWSIAYRRCYDTLILTFGQYRPQVYLENYRHRAVVGRYPGDEARRLREGLPTQS
jgi:hypothetical protein